MTARGNNDPYYDLFEDWDLIVSSFLSQYGLRIKTKEFETVGWEEFKALLSGISPDTALGRIVAIRAETDKEIIKNFNKDQKRIYDEWRNRRVEQMPLEVYENDMKALEKMFSQLCGR